MGNQTALGKMRGIAVISTAKIKQGPKETFRPHILSASSLSKLSTFKLSSLYNFLHHKNKEVGVQDSPPLAKQTPSFAKSKGSTSARC